MNRGDKVRVFIAINLEPEVKMNLENIIQDLRRITKRGNFTRIENLHLTLAFLGEVSKNQVEELLKLMNEIALNRKSFCIELSGFGKFMNRGEALYWCEIRENENLKELQQSLITRLNLKEFSVDDKPFKPHITLARRCIINRYFDDKKFAQSIKPMLMKVSKVHLMKSERLEGKLVYSSLGEVALQEE